MSVKLLFPTPIFERNFLDSNLNLNQGYDESYATQLKNEIDAMRRKDPEGRRISNAYTGWQSNDGIDRNPLFQKCMNRISTFFHEEVCTYFGVSSKIRMGNSWANINDKGAWNMPHLHNGCWFSGVLYISAGGDEGDIQFIDPMPKVVGNMPHGRRSNPSHRVAPSTGNCILFPSGAMHMVEPNFSKSNRYSISFNVDLVDYNNKPLPWDENEFTFKLDEKGDPILS